LEVVVIGEHETDPLGQLRKPENKTETMGSWRILLMRKEQDWRFSEAALWIYGGRFLINCASSQPTTLRLFFE
jgi:hypothetical protein